MFGIWKCARRSRRMAIENALKELALAAGQDVPAPRSSPLDDELVERLANVTNLRFMEHPAFEHAALELMRDPALEPFLPWRDQPDPYILLPGRESSLPGEVGSRIDFSLLVLGLVDNARRLQVAQQTEGNEAALVRAVLSNYEELKRAGKGEEIGCFVIRGLAGISLPRGAQIETPWGEIKGVDLDSSRDRAFGRRRPPTGATLVTPERIRVFMSREEEPVFPDPGPSPLASTDRAAILTSLLFALWSVDSGPIAPIVTFESVLYPFSNGVGFSYPPPPANSIIATRAIEPGEIKPLEELAATLAENHHDGVNLAAVRTIRAISGRSDRSDALIDAVIAWENLVGTRLQTARRVTRALTCLAEPGVEKQQAFCDELRRVYDVRSRVVHGDVVDPRAAEEAGERAIEVSLRAMLELYRRGGDWMAISSSERAERLAVEDTGF
jgi:hypothetical protein